MSKHNIMNTKRIITKNPPKPLFPMVCEECGEKFDIDQLQEMGKHFGSHYTGDKKCKK